MCLHETALFCFPGLIGNYAHSPLFTVGAATQVTQVSHDNAVCACYTLTSLVWFLWSL